MQKLNKLIIILCLTSIQVCHYSYAFDAAGVKAAAELNIGLGNLSDSINNAKAEFPKIGVEGASKIADAITTVAIVAGGTAAGYGIGYALYYTYKEVKAGVKATARACKPKWFTSTEEQLHEKEVSNRLKLLESKEELYESLATHAHETKNHMGIPCACERAANKYASIAGITALNEIVEEFKKTYCSKPFWTRCAA